MFWFSFFPNEKFWITNEILLKYHSYSLIDNESGFFQIMAWRLKDGNPLPELMSTETSEAISQIAKNHYNNVIMGAIGSLITSLTIVYSTVYSDADQRKHQSPASLAFVWGIDRGEFPAQMASNAENASISWRHHAQTDTD